MLLQEATSIRKYRRHEGVYLYRDNMSKQHPHGCQDPRFPSRAWHHSVSVACHLPIGHPAAMMLFIRPRSPSHIASWSSSDALAKVDRGQHGEFGLLLCRPTIGKQRFPVRSDNFLSLPAFRFSANCPTVALQDYIGQPWLPMTLSSVHQLSFPGPTPKTCHFGDVLIQLFSNYNLTLVTITLRNQLYKLSDISHPLTGSIV